jgi:hypothetical protein
MKVSMMSLSASGNRLTRVKFLIVAGKAQRSGARSVSDERICADAA